MSQNGLICDSSAFLQLRVDGLVSRDVSDSDPFVSRTVIRGEFTESLLSTFRSLLTKDGLVVESGQLGDLLLHLPGPSASPSFSLRSEVLLLATSFV